MSFSVISRCGSAASRSRILENWFWSAMQKSTGSEDLMNGSQNCFKTDGREVYQKAVPAAASTSRASATKAFFVEKKLRSEPACAETFEPGIDDLLGAERGNSVDPGGKPEGRPGHENCGA